MAGSASNCAGMRHRHIAAGRRKLQMESNGVGSRDKSELDHLRKNEEEINRPRLCVREKQEPGRKL